MTRNQFKKACARPFAITTLISIVLVAPLFVLAARLNPYEGGRTNTPLAFDEVERIVHEEDVVDDCPEFCSMMGDRLVCRYLPKPIGLVYDGTTNNNGTPETSTDDYCNFTVSFHATETEFKCFSISNGFCLTGAKLHAYVQTPTCPTGFQGIGSYFWIEVTEPCD